MTHLPFTKMHGTGNDFIIIDNRQEILTTDELVRLAPELCHRRFGIGGDGIISMQPPAKPGLDYTMFYRNADGSDAGMCGNGARCLALFAARTDLGHELSFNVHDTVYRAKVAADRPFVKLGFPITTQVKEYHLEDENGVIYQARAGTEHIVLNCDKSKLEDEANLRQRGRKLRHHPRFDPPGTNVNFMHGASPGRVQLQTYERGVEDLTLACGTGAIATALTWHHLNRGENTDRIKVEVKGGTLEVDFNYNPNSETYTDICLSGGATFVFEGTYEL